MITYYIIKQRDFNLTRQFHIYWFGEINCSCQPRLAQDFLYWEGKVEEEVINDPHREKFNCPVITNCPLLPL